VRFVDAPVTGSSPKAEAGTLTIMAGGAAEDVERARPLFEVMGEVVIHVGELGQGQTVKLINNAVAAANAVTLGQALIVASRTGVDLDALEQVMAAGRAARRWPR
jgi:3-hydroxyisobutyrate dehydrogenase-like beta-hydroxyacid dehydrogenase